MKLYLWRSIYTGEAYWAEEEWKPKYDGWELIDERTIEDGVTVK